MTASVELTPAPSGGDDRILVVALTGALDYSNADRLRENVGDTLAPEHRELVLDLSGLEFCDSTGLRTLLDIRELLGERGGAVSLVNLNARLTKMFRITGLIKAFSVTTDLAEALGAARARIRSSSD
ncbi:STAS domain-containing protein [Sphaerimonospora mesophila]|uniref:STAS domain-containing protein n=1 Tax=Sphaerimonospora mesophila TaxID=37483 RepID=UPI0006E130B2